MKISIVTGDGTTTYSENVELTATSSDFTTVYDATTAALDEAEATSSTTSTASITTDANGNLISEIPNVSDEVMSTPVSELTAGATGTMTLQEIYEKAAATYDVDINLLAAVTQQESNFNVDSTSHSGAQGLMQLMPGTAEDLGVTDAYDAYQNVMGGAKYLSKMLSRYNGDVTLALAAYNAGPGNVDKYGGVPPFDETQNYVTKVTGYYNSGTTIPDETVTVGSASTVVSEETTSTTTNSSSTSSGTVSADVLASYQEMVTKANLLLLKLLEQQAENAEAEAEAAAETTTEVTTDTTAESTTDTSTETESTVTTDSTATTE